MWKYRKSFKESENLEINGYKLSMAFKDFKDITSLKLII